MCRYRPGIRHYKQSGSILSSGKPDNCANISGPGSRYFSLFMRILCISNTNQQSVIKLHQPCHFLYYRLESIHRYRLRTGWPGSVPDRRYIRFIFCGFGLVTFMEYSFRYIEIYLGHNCFWCHRWSCFSVDRQIF